MTTRTPIPQNSIIHLQNDEGIIYDYRVIKLLTSSTEGSSCLCYIANRLEDNDVTAVILKEFYPKDSIFNVIRDSNGALNIQLLLSTNESTPLLRILNSFKNSRNHLEKYSQYDLTTDDVCSSEMPDLLTGNGTFYYENLLLPGSFSWKSASVNSKTKDDELFDTAAASIRFLGKIHSYPNTSGFGDALIDFKPEDVLIPIDESVGLPSFGHARFCDFGSVLEMGHRYPTALLSVSSTPDYRPPTFEYGTGNTLVDKKTENYTFAKVLNIVCLNLKRKGRIKEEIIDDISKLSEDLLSMKTDISEDKIEKKLLSARDNIRQEEYRINQKKMKLQEPIISFFHILILVITTLSYILVGIVMAVMCLKADNVRRYIEINHIPAWSIFAFLCTIIVLLTLMKYFTALYSRRVARTKISCDYYEKELNGEPVRTGEFNTFLTKSGRKNTTYQDESEANKARQRLRHFTWSALAIAFLGAIALSIYVDSCPIFLVFAMIATICHMYADYIPSMHLFFERYYRTRGIYLNQLPQKNTLLRKKSIYYYDEYKKTKEYGQPFDLQSKFYCNPPRNPYTIKDFLKENKANGNPDTDLLFTTTIIRNIYKMAFDQAKNKNLIVTLSILAATIIAILLDFVAFTGHFASYFKIPHNAYVWVILSAISITTVANLIQVLNSYHEEMTVADYSYKSRFMREFALNHFLVEDIISGKITKIDICRGITQSEGIIFSAPHYRRGKPKTRDDRRRLEERKTYNTCLIHHDIIADQRRLFLTVLMAFVASISLLVWHFGLYYLTLPLIVIFILIYIIVGKIILPKATIRRICTEIERALHEKEEKSTSDVEM